MSNTAALDIEYARVITARFVTKRDGSTMACMTCGQPLEMGKAYAAQANGGWHSYCERCAASTQVQVAGLVRRIETLVTPLGDTVPASITNLVDVATPYINQAMALSADTVEGRSAFTTAKGLLLNIRSAVGAAKAANAPAPVRTNSYGGKCGKCSEYVEAGKGRIEKVNGRWVVFHLDNECPTPQAAAPQVTVAVGLYMFDAGRIAKVYKTRNNRLAIKDLVTIAVGTNPDGTTKYKGSFQYRPGGMKAIREALTAGTVHLMTQSEASAFGQMYSFCVNCGLYLDDDRSVAAGYGPTCADNKGWHYPTYEEASVILGRPAGPNKDKVAVGAVAAEAAAAPSTPPLTGVCEYCDEDITFQYTLDNMENWRDMWVTFKGEVTCAGDDAAGPGYEHKPMVD